MKDLLNISQVLGRSEMKKIMAGSGGCSESITCSDGTKRSCTSTGSDCSASGDCIQCGNTSQCC